MQKSSEGIINFTIQNALPVTGNATLFGLNLVLNGQTDNGLNNTVLKFLEPS